MDGRSSRQPMTSHQIREKLDSTSACGSRLRRQPRTRRRCSHRVSFKRYYDPTTGQFLSVDPLVAATNQPYQYAEDDPANESDPTGLASAGTICGQYGSGSSQCAAAQQRSLRVVNEELANNAASNPCVHIIDVAGPVGGLLKRNVGTITTVVATGLCIAPGTDVGCGFYQATALAARTYQRSESGTPLISAQNAIDAATTAATFGLVDLPTASGTAGFSTTAATLLRAHAALPEGVGLLLDLNDGRN